MTGRPLPLNHQNALPLVMRPNTQDGGGPATDDDPEVQIERLARGPVMGPEHADDRPVAVSNPIFVDVDGGGFKPSNAPPG